MPGHVRMWDCQTRCNSPDYCQELVTEAAMNGARWDNYQMLRRLSHVADYFKLCIDNMININPMVTQVWIWSQILNSLCLNVVCFLPSEASIHWSKDTQSLTVIGCIYKLFRQQNGDKICLLWFVKNVQQMVRKGPETARLMGHNVSRNGGKLI